MKAQHHRFAIWNLSQHPFRHTLNEFAFSNPALPGVTNIEAALNYMIAVLYPQTKPAVANVAALPLVGNTLNDFRVVQDDGDGNAAGYRWEQREGEVSPSWHKIYDMDWGIDSILQQFNAVAQAQFAVKLGNDDLDNTGAPITGLYAGQRIFGGITANTNLTLSANAGDGTGSPTGFVQVTDNFRPTDDDAYSIGTPTERFYEGYFSQGVFIQTLGLQSGIISDSSGTISFSDENLITTGNITGAAIRGTSLIADNTTNQLTIVPGSITCTSGAISFGNENLSTTGTLASGTHTIGNMVIATGSITNTTGNISFDNENLSTTGTFAATSAQLGNININSNTIATTNANGNLLLNPNGTGLVNVAKRLEVTGTSSFLTNVAITGTLTVTGDAAIDNININGNTISSTNVNGIITLDPNGTGTVVTAASFLPDADDSYNLGAAILRFSNLYLSDLISDGTNQILMSEILALRNILFRDTGRSQAVQAGDTLFYDSGSGTWLASPPDTEISHGAISGLTTGDAGHTQFVMLAGRSGGQTIRGGTAGGENLILESTANASKGVVYTMDDFLPFTTAAFSGGWTGVDLGSNARRWNDIFMSGEVKGLRLENVTDGTMPAFSGQNIGRLVFNTDDNLVYVDTGAELIPVGNITGNGGSQVTGTVGAVAATLTAPADAIGFILAASSDNSNNMRWKLGGTASASDGNRLEPGRDTGYIPGAANISIISESGTNEYQIQWITRS